MAPPPESAIALEQLSSPHTTSAPPDLLVPSYTGKGETDLFHIDRDLPVGLFHDVALNRGQYDGKAITDSTSKYSLDYIHAAHAEAVGQLGYSALQFYKDHFEIPVYEVPQIPRVGINQYIKNMWDELTYYSPQDRGTLIKSSYPNLKPGERYAEACYHDLSDGVAGLLVEARHADQANRVLIEQKVMNVANGLREDVDRFGYIYNGKRTYYAGRSQPPVFAEIIEAMDNYAQEMGEASSFGPHLLEEFLPQIVTEYEWWMNGESKVDPQHDNAYEHVVCMPDGSILSRHWSMYDTPRPESYKEDIETAASAPHIDHRAIWRNIRILCEFGHDMTARGTADPEDLATANMANKVPPELNSRMHKIESIIAKGHTKANRTVLAQEFQHRASRRQKAMDKYLWNEKDGCYYDYDFVEGRQSTIKSMATAYPPALGASSPEQTARVARTLRGQDIFHLGGFVSTLIDSPHQWDGQNGFPPDQLKGFQAQVAAGDIRGATETAYRVLARDYEIYERLGVMVEKTNVKSRVAQPGHGGEYRVQRGFLWTIGTHVVLKDFLRRQQKANPRMVRLAIANTAAARQAAV